MYLGYMFFIREMIFQYFLPYGENENRPLYFLDHVFWSTKYFNFDKAQFTSLFLLSFVLLVLYLRGQSLTYPEIV